MRRSSRTGSIKYRNMEASFHHRFHVHRTSGITGGHKIDFETVIPAGSNVTHPRGIMEENVRVLLRTLAESAGMMKFSKYLLMQTWEKRGDEGLG
jgi:hypothetical protein